VTRAQLLALGIGSRAIERRLARGQLIAVFRAVYAVGHLPTLPLARAHGALLACGSRTALSHGSAATLWGIQREWRLPLEVITANDRRPQGVRVHRAAWLTRGDIRVHFGLRVTTPALTLLHVAPRLRTGRLARAVNDLRLERLVTIEQLERVVERFPRHAGARLVAPILAAGRPEPTRSALEDRFEEFARVHALPGYELNVHVCGYRVDVYFPRERLIVEIDGFEVHRTRQAFERDREQDAVILEREGIPTVRVTHGRLTGPGAAGEAARLHTILADRRY
jgi:hypothetical protein